MLTGRTRFLLMYSVQEAPTLNETPLNNMYDRATNFTPGSLSMILPSKC
jgi:hypothetical protein